MMLISPYGARIWVVMQRKLVDATERCSATGAFASICAAVRKLG